MKPDYAEGQNNIANIYMKKNDNEKAIYFFEKALLNKPNLIQANFNLAKIYTKLGDKLQISGDIEGSIKNYKQAIKYKPDYVEALNNWGISLQKLNKIDEAKDIFENSIKVKPDYFLSHNNLGNILMSMGEKSAAIKCYEEAIRLNSSFYEAYSNLGIVLNSQGKFDESIIQYKKAIKINPNFELAYNNLAVSQVNHGLTNEAIESYNAAFKINSNETKYIINSNLIFPIIPKSNKELEFYRDKYNSNIDLLQKRKFKIEDPQNEINPSTFYLSYSEFNNLEIKKKTSSFFRKAIPSINYNLNKNIKKTTSTIKKNKIEIGFISEFFTDHTIGKLYRGLIKKINSDKFRTTIFHLPKTKIGKIKTEIDGNVDNIINLKGDINNQQKQIEKENLDIIFYPDIGMVSSTYFLAHARLAPVQIISWGHPETSGISTIDYFLSSSLIETKDSHKFYSEKLVNFNRIPMFFIPPNLPELNLSRSDFQLPENKNLYCCPQSLFKIHPDFDRAINKIINKDKDSTIIFIETSYKKHKELLIERWSKNYPHINEKVIFVKSMPFEKFLSLLNISDILLDPFYFGAGVSFSESMLVGTPTVTMPGKFMRSRIVMGAYKQMQISNPPIANDIDHYVDIAVNLSKNKKENAKLKESLRQAAEKKLFNDLESVREFENFFENVYKLFKLHFKFS